MKAANAKELHALALVHGAEATINGRPFNSGGHVHSSNRPLPPKPAETPSISMADVERLISQRVAGAVQAAEARMKQDMTEITNTMSLALAAAVRENKTIPGREIREHRMKVQYDQMDRVTSAVITPVYVGN